MKTFAFTLLLFFSISFCLKTKAQSFPWLSPLKICTSTDGINYSASTTFQDSAGVASVIKLGSDTFICAFQWFPMPFQNATNWDKIAVKFSYNGGITWTSPTTCVFSGIPMGYQRPWDPVLLRLPSGQIRMYFSEGVNNPPAGSVDTWSAVSTDGINYTVDAGVRYNNATYNVIDPSVVLFSNVYYYNAWSGVNSDGAFRGNSTDGLTFTTTAGLPYDGSHTWLGNFMKDGTTMRFYGTGMGTIWCNTSTDMITWNGYTNTNVTGADPSVAKNSSGTYVMIYTGAPTTSGLNENNSQTEMLSVFPVPASNYLSVQFYAGQFSPNKNYSIEILDLNGNLVSTKLIQLADSRIDLQNFSDGIYFYTVLQDSEILKRGKILVKK